jgi:hypothetical protein
MRAEHYRDALAKLDLTQAQAAYLFDLGERTSSRYATEGGAPVSLAVVLRAMVEKKLTVEDVTRLKKGR